MWRNKLFCKTKIVEKFNWLRDILISNVSVLDKYSSLQVWGSHANFDEWRFLEHDGMIINSKMHDFLIVAAQGRIAQCNKKIHDVELNEVHLRQLVTLGNMECFVVKKSEKFRPTLR